MSLQQRVIEQNNLAVAMIEEGAYDEACSKLSTVFQSYQGYYDENDCHYYSPSISLDQCMTQGHPMSSSVDPDFPFMYSDAIRISPKIAAVGIPKQDVAAILLFNLALSHHLSALDSMNPDADLRKALYVYEMVYTMQQQKKDSFLISNLMFVLSILNNIGIIHQWRNNDAIASRCFDKLLSVLMLLTSTQSNDGKSKIEEVIFRGFYRNVVLHRPPCASAAWFFQFLSKKCGHALTCPLLLIFSGGKVWNIFPLSVSILIVLYYF